MPELVCLVFQGEPVIFRHYVALLVEGLEDHEVGAAAICTYLGDLERAEAAREGKLCFVGDILVAKDQNRVLLGRAPTPSSPTLGGVGPRTAFHS